ncbi:carbohydrate sulfotransferase 10-like [Palaemon carinicauda]|uniref:carbohydrate sulfotransferase 10-like n=1 Tax=Palaemon carinicauda TaxID=392227 RepID=UPI0035B5D7F2
MSRMRRVIHALCHPLGVSIGLIILALLWSASNVNIKKTSEDILKILQLENLRQLQSLLRSVPIENSSSFGLLSTDSVLSLEDNFQKAEGFGNEDTIDLYQEEGSKEENAVFRRLKKRRKKVVDVCRSGKFKDCHIQAVLNGRIFFFHHYNTTVCTISKSGSSTWGEHLRKVNGEPPYNKLIFEDNIRMAFLRKPIKVIMKDIKSSSKIITVRHPLTRLESAFRTQYNNGKGMEPHRPLEEAELRKRIAGTFWPERFRRFWLPALFANNMVPPNTHIKVGIKEPVDPSVVYSEEEYERLYNVLKPKITFVQFLKFVLKTYEEGNPEFHWSPYYQWCCPCHFDYDYITKVETLSEDLKYTFKKLGIPRDPHVVMNKKRRSKELEYYRNVPETLRREIYKYLKPDMDLFEYELPKNFLNL